MSGRKEWTGEQFKDANKKAMEHTIYALTIDGAHHKQWYLEQILETLGGDLEEAQKVFGYEKGIAP